MNSRLKMFITREQAEEAAAGNFQQPITLHDGRSYWIGESPVFEVFRNTAYVTVIPADEEEPT